MKIILLTIALVLLASPAFAKEYTIKEVSDPAGKRPYYFAPAKLTIQPGDTVTFVNAQEDMHDVMFINVPKGVEEMIMSSMQEKEGDKWSYTFTVPGTYQFHCHPHESLNMKGTLIVGQASKPGETKAMDHHKLAKNAESGVTASAAMSNGTLPQGTGKLNRVDVTKRTINVTHDLIQALGWPRMTMEFPVDKGVDLSGVAAGDSVTFTLKAGANDTYSVSTLKKN